MHRRKFIGGSAAVLATASAPHKASISKPAITFYSDFWLNLHHTLYRQADALQTAYNGGVSSLHPYSGIFMRMQRICRLRTNALGIVRWNFTRAGMVDEVLSSMIS